MDLNSGAAFISTDLNQYSTPDLIRFLLTSFRASEYEEVTRIIASRERDLRIEKIDVELSLATKAAEIERIREQLERAEEELAIARKEEKHARREAKEWHRILGENIELKEKIEVLEKEKETGAWCCRARGDGDCNRCNGVKLEGRLGNGGTAMGNGGGVKLEARLGNGATAMGNGGAVIVGVIEIDDEEDDMDVKSCGRCRLRQKRRRLGTFSKELEAKVIALFERFKTDKNCSQLIANALDADNTYSAAQVYRKLRQLGLLVPRRRLTKASENLEEEEVIKTTENSDEETLVAIKERRKGKKSKPSTKEAATKTISQHGGILDGEHDNDNEPLSTILKSKGKKSKPSNKEATETISPRGGALEGEHDPDDEPLSNILKKVKKRKSPTKEAVTEITSQHEGTPEGEHDPDNKPLSTILKNKVKKRKSPAKEAVMEIASQHEGTPEGEHDPDNKPLSTILKNKVKKRKSATKESVTEIISQHEELREEHVSDNELLSTILKSKVKKRKSPTNEVVMETTSQLGGMAVDEHAPIIKF